MTVHLSAHAERCILRNLPSGSKRREGGVPCHKPIRLAIKANEEHHTLTYRILLFTERHHRLQMKHFTIYQRRAAVPKRMPCTGWLICDRAPVPCAVGEAECYEPERRLTFPAYGNNRIGDCPFAAVADWLIIAQGLEPPEDEVVGDYEAANASHQNVLNIWKTIGIDGTYATEGYSWASSRGELTPPSVREALLDYGPLIVDFTDPEGENGHNAVVDGFTPDGPIIVTWRRTFQMTWETWALDADFLEAPQLI